MSGSRKSELELVLEHDGERLRLVAPDVGIFTGALERGAALAPGQPAGALVRLGRATLLVVPAGAGGVVTSNRPERVHAPVGFGEVLYELDPSGVVAALQDEDVAEVDGALVLRSPQSGRFYHRPAPDAPVFCAAGDTLEDGSPIGLIEVMKTFAHVPYKATGGLPARARLVRFLAADGADVTEGEPLAQVEPN